MGELLASAARALGQASAKTHQAAAAALQAALDAADLDAVLLALLTKDKFQPRKLGDHPDVRQAQTLALELLDACRQHEAWLHQQRVSSLARVLLSEYAALKRERGWVDMNDIERAALRLLGDEMLSAWVQEKLDAQVRHLLIDEFQDTNPLQWQALRAWLESYAGAGRAPSVFIVGDPKQSIYRFRRAEPQVFRAAQRFVKDSLCGTLLSCDHTRRNAQRVIATVNAAMQAAADDPEDGYAHFRSHTSASQQPGEVWRLPVIERPEASDAPVADASPWRDSLRSPRDVPEETLRTREARQAAAWLAA